MIDQFNKDQFEKALPQVPWTSKFEMGEWVYFIPVTVGKSTPTNKRIVVRSSIGKNGIAANTGKDSIRHWVEYESKGKWWALSKDEYAWTTRVPGWERRLTESLRRLWRIAIDDNKRGENGKASVAGNGKSGQVEAQRSMASTGTPNGLFNGYGVQKVLEPGVSGNGQSGKRGTGVDLPGLLGNSNGDPFNFLGGDTTTTIEPTKEKSNGDSFGFLGNDDLGGLGESYTGATREDTGSPSSSANAKQLEAIEADIHIPLRVLAPPGSGKTFLLSHRYSTLLSRGADPNSIIAVTFSRAMADELLVRIARENPSIAELKATDPTADAITQITTIHALCLRILRTEGDKRCVPDREARIKGWQVKKALEEIINDLWPVILHRPGYKEVQAYIDAAKGEGLDSEHDLEFFAGTLDKFGNEVGQELHLARRRFDEWCQRNQVIQFADMVYEVDMKLRKDPAFKLRWQTKIQYAMIDEGQDTSGQAMRVLTTLAAPQNNITIVGDTDQLLYRFSGATPEANLYEGFESRYPNGRLIVLETNYRSTKNIIAAYNQMIRNNYKLEGFDGPYDGKYFKNIQARQDAPDGKPVSFEMYETPTEEAQAVAKQIKQMIDEGRSPEDFFIGARTSAQVGYLEGPLVQNDIPYINLNGGSFWAMKHIADVLAYIRLAFNEDDGEAFERIYNVASKWNVYPWGKDKGEYCNHRFLGQEFLKACYDSTTKAPQYKWRWVAVKERSSWRNGVQDLEELLSEVQKVLADDGVKAAITYIVDNCYASYLAASEGIVGGDASDNGKLDDLETIKEISNQFGADVQKFLAYVAKAQDAAEATKKGDWKGHVVISTCHKLKGLERPVVFGIGLVEGVDKNGSPVGLLPHTYSMRAPAIQGMLPMGGKGRIEDERDICYVLVSRAKDECHLTGCSTYRNWTLGPSRFITEMGILDTAISRDEEIVLDALNGEEF